MKKIKRTIGAGVAILLAASLSACGFFPMRPPREHQWPENAYEEPEEPLPLNAADTAETESVEVQQPSASTVLSGVQPVTMGTGAKSATIMVYMNGSDLESNSGEASTDISEMIASGIGKNVNVIIQTMGTRRWQDHGISSQTAQTYRISDGKLELVRDGLGQLDCTKKETLSEFIGFCKSNYPADRYLCLFWDHGGGPVYGFGYDEWQAEGASLTIAEMAQAFSENSDIHFDMIGMDCCIMASVETCYALSPFCKYALLSEDFESGLGWYYTDWMKKLEADPGMATPLLGKNIIDDIITDNETTEGGASACMCLFNEATIEGVLNAWKAYAYKNEEALLGTNYSREHTAKGRAGFDLWGVGDDGHYYDDDEGGYGGYDDYWDYWGYDGSNVTLDQYYISDMLALTESIDNSSEEAKNLISFLKAAVSYYGHTSDKNELTGMAVSLPYGDPDFYQEMKSVYQQIGLDQEYVGWLEQFVSASGGNDYYDFGSFDSSWGGWGSYEQEYGCNPSGGGSGEYSTCPDGYCDPEDYEGDYYDDWLYDYEDDTWYWYGDDYAYYYDDESDSCYYYDEGYDDYYYYDDGGWYGY